MKKKLIFALVLFCSSIFLTDVYATNDVDYNLTITKDYAFKEVINYKISDYKQPNNGFNYFNSIINDDIYTDILYNTKYKKKVTKSNGKYDVTLSHTYSEYTLSNSNFLNTCFEKPNYKYDVDKISFSNSGQFNCLYGDNLKISIVTDFEVTSNNADSKENNKYIWNVKNNNFNLNFSIKKTYESSKQSDIYDDIEDEEENDTDEEKNDNNQKEDTSNKNSKNTYLIIILSVVVIITIISINILLKIKGNKVNKL